jgi:hypothetical protein
MELSENHERARRQRQRGTGKWFVESNLFAEWLALDCSFL